MSANLVAQENYFSYFSNQYLFINPAQVGLSKYTRLSSAYRNQWPAMGNAFTTYTGGFDSHFSKSKASIGVNVLFDKQGGNAFNKSNVDIIYGYRIINSQFFLMQMALQVGVMQWSRNATTLFDANGTPELVSGKTITQPNFALGLVANTRKYHAGMAAHNINRNFIKFSSDFYSQPLSITMHYLYNVYYYSASVKNNLFVFSPLILANWYAPYITIQYGVMAQHMNFEAGLALRHKQFLPTSTVYKVGILIGNFKITYNYDFNMQTYNYAFPISECHELGLIYYFIDNEPKKPNGAVKCPNINNSSW